MPNIIMHDVDHLKKSASLVTSKNPPAIFDLKRISFQYGKRINTNIFELYPHVEH
jgi:hypothetical protein